MSDGFLQTSGKGLNRDCGDWLTLALGSLYELRFPTSYRLEALRGDREGQFSIRINDQWRVCFTWSEHGATEIEIADYH